MTETGPIHDPVAAVALLEEPTRRRLYEFVADRDEPVSREQASQALGISRELAAFHLDRLLAAGLLEAAYRRLGPRRGPGGGRPAKLYRRSRTEVAVSFPPRDYQGLAEELAQAVDHIEGGAGQEAAASVARGRCVAAGAEVRRSAGPRPGRRRLSSALVGHLRDSGFEPQVDVATGDIRLRNCPYRALAASHRELTCGMNLAWAQGVLTGLGSAPYDAELTSVPGQCCVVFERHD